MYIFVSTQCSSWLVDTVEAACQVKEDIAKSFREGDKALMVYRGANKLGRFLEVVVFAKVVVKVVYGSRRGEMDRAGSALRASCVFCSLPPMVVRRSL